MENTYNTPYTAAPQTGAAGQQEEEQSSFNIIFWAMKFVRFWYLFVIALAVAYSLSYLENRKWQPSFQTSTQMMIDEGRMPNTMGSSLMSGFSTQAGFRNSNNQQLLLKSRDLTEKTIEKMPELTVDYFSRGRFKENNFYKMSPIDIVHTYIAPPAYGMEFEFINHDRNSFEIVWKQGDNTVSIKGKYNEPVIHNLFRINVLKTPIYSEKDFDKFYFRFLSKDYLTSYFNSRLGVRFAMEGASVLEISLNGKVAQRDIDFLNMLSETYLEQSLERKNEMATKTINFIDEQLAGISDSVSIAENRLKSYRISNQIVDVSSFSGQIMSDARQLQTSVAAFKLKDAYIEHLENYLQKNIQEDLIATPNLMGITDPNLVALVTQFNDLLFKKKEVGEKNPLYANYEARMQALKEMILEALKTIRAVQQIERNDLNIKNREIENRIADLPTQERQMSNYSREFRIQDNYYTFLLQKKAEAQIQKASNSPDNLVFDTARNKGATNSGEPKKTTTTYLLIGLLIPIAFVLLREFLHNKIADKNDIERYSSYPYVGAIRHTSSQNPVAVQENPRSGLAESYRVIRTRIEFLVQRQYPTRLLVTSTESGDGKTAFSTNMAAMYAMTGRRTILVDLDLRKPSVGERLRLRLQLSGNKDRGISNYLIHQEENLEDLIISDPKYKFDILPGGTIPPNPGELIRSKRLVEMLDILSTKYDHIVIDTSPIGLVADAYALMFMVDANLFLVPFHIGPVNLLAYKVSINRLPVSPRYRRNVKCRLHPSLDLKAVDTRLDKLGDIFNHTQVTGIKKIGSPFIFIYRQIFSRPLFFHHRIFPAAWMRTGAAVGIPPGKIIAQQAPSRIGYAHRPMDKAFYLHVLRNPSPYFGNLR